MFKIGDFSRLTQVSIKTLHHYDEIGLFRPNHVDPWTGYRYYAMEQVPRLNRILALKGLGLTLDQIGQMLDDRLSADELRGMLRLRCAQLQQQIDETRVMLAQVEIRLNQIDQEGQMSNVEVMTKQVPALTIAGARQVVAGPEQMRECCIALDQAVCGLIATHGLKTDGISLAIYYAGPENGIDVEMAYPIKVSGRLPTGEGKVAVHTLPAATVAYAVYYGSYDDFGAVGQLHGAINQWIECNGYQNAGPTREFYLRPPQSSSDRSGIMEIQYPIDGLSRLQE
jgi:DNA-binding transcriptional MerR regulator